MQGKKDDPLLWNSFLSGDDRAYECIYMTHIQNMFSYGMTFTNDCELVRDCIQDLFTHLYRNRRNLGPTDNIRLYLFAGLKNAIFNTLSRQDTHRRLIRLYRMNEPVDDSEEDRLVDREEETMLQDRIAGIKSLLTSRQQEIIHYRFVEDLSIEEISKLLDVNYQSIANIIQRALKKIRHFYAKQ